MRLITFLALILAGSLYAAPRIWEPPFFNGIAAQVDTVIITYDDIRRELAGYSAQLKAKNISEEEYVKYMEEATTQVRENLIDRQLLIQEFKRKGYAIPPKEIDTEFRRILRTDYHDHLSELVDALQHQGMNTRDFRKHLEEMMMTQSLQARFRRNLPTVTPEQVLAYYQAHQADYAQEATLRLSVIMLKPITDEPAEVLLQNAQDIKAKLAAGATFGAMAEQFSQDASKDKAGDWGWLKFSELSPELQKAVKDLPIGAIAEPISLEGPKVLLAKVVDRHNEGVSSLEDVRNTIEAKLKEATFITAYNKWMSDLRAKSFVKVNE